MQYRIYKMWGDAGLIGHLKLEGLFWPQYASFCLLGCQGVINR